MFNSINNIPPSIQDFYEEVDVDGVVGVKELPRYDLKSWDFVELVKSRGNTEFTIYCINKACESERWQFHDEYIEWLEGEPKQLDGRYKVVDEDGLPLYDFKEEHAAWASHEPVDTSTDAGVKVVEFNSENAVSTRYTSIYKTLPITLSSGVSTEIDIGVGKDGVLGIDNVKDAVAAFTAGMEVTGGTYWIMADNSVELVTIDDLNQVIIDFNTRKQEVFNAYGLWRSGDRLTPFTYG